MKHPAPLLSSVACTAMLLTGCASTVATLDGPNHRQKLSTPHEIAVNFDTQRADPATFRAQLNGNDITDAFVFQDDTAVLQAFVYPPINKSNNTHQPHEITVTAEPAVDDKGRPRGQSFTQTVAFFPPTIAVQGNVGLGASSRIHVPHNGQTNAMIRLPRAANQTTAVTIKPVPTQLELTGTVTAQDMIDCVALNGQAPGEPITLTLAPGQRVAVFTIEGHRPGLNTLRVEAPGYAASTIDTSIDRESLTASVDAW